MKIGSLADVLNDSRMVTDFTKDGKCTGCGNCCSNYLPVTEDEIRVIRGYIKRHNIEPVKHITVLNTTLIDMTCPFLEMTGNKRCRIYKVRPAVCRYFICNKPGQIKPDWKYIAACKPVRMRETFFGD